MRLLVLGSSGMLGSAVYRHFSAKNDIDVWGTLRGPSSLKYFSEHNQKRLLLGVDVLDQDALIRVIDRVRPNVVINCVGLIKQVADAKDPLLTLPINSIFPHRLSRLCALGGARVVHISTDCVFSGREGYYSEADSSDADDLYGKSKYIGELHDQPHAITLRTSIIGHELGSSLALVDWFLSQNRSVRGFSRAFFSGLPTVELARVIDEYVLPRPDLMGLYHVAATPISKLELLRLVSSEYGKSIRIEPDDRLIIDRSLNGTKFYEATGYEAPPWPELIRRMRTERHR